MAYNDTFNSFATDSELWPIWNEDYGYCPDLELFTDTPLSMDIPPLPPAHSEVEKFKPLPQTHISSSALLTDSDPFFTNPQDFPYLGNQWDPSFPFPAPAPQAFQAPAAQPTVQHTVVDDFSGSNVDENDDDELDFALALAPEPETAPPTHYQHHFYIPPQNAMQNQLMFYPQTSKASKRRVVDDEDDFMEEPMTFESEPFDFGDEEDPTGGFKLPASKSPIMEAMVVCALNGWGIEIITNNRATSTTSAEVVFRVTDFNRYYKISRAICSKQRPTDDLGSRIKSLRRWFVNFPKKKDRCENAFTLIVKPSIAKKVNEIIERNTKTLGLTKRRRRQ